MKTIGRRLLAYYAIFVIVLGGMLYFDGDLLPQTPITGEPVSRLVLVALDALTFTGDGTAHAVTELNRWSGSNDPDGGGSAFLALLGMLLLGYVVFCLAIAPIYAYAWYKGIDRSWMIKFISVHWDDPRFRHITLIYSSIAVLLIAVISAFSAPHLVAACVTLGAFIALRYPAPAAAALFVALDLYGDGQQHRGQTATPPVSPARNSGQVTPSSHTPAAMTSSAPVNPPKAPARQQSTQKHSAQPKSDSWQDKLNR